MASGIVEYFLVTISSKAKDETTFPFLIKCWTSLGSFEEVDAQDAKLAIFAQVFQGNRPVLNAKVKAL